MAGHSKWANIQHRKGKQDGTRGKLFTKIVRELTVAARAGGGDPAGNPRLRLALDKATAASMPKDNIERAIKKASGELDDVHYEETCFEGYAPGGVAVLVACTTDNRQPTLADVRHAFAKFGGNLGTDGSVAYLFTKVGVLWFAPGSDEARITDVAIKAGAADVIAYPDDGSLEVLTAAEDFVAVRAALAAQGLSPAEAQLTMRADTEVPVVGDTAKQVAKLLDWLDDLDDVQVVHANADLPADAYA